MLETHRGLVKILVKRIFPAQRNPVDAGPQLGNIRKIVGPHLVDFQQRKPTFQFSEAVSHVEDEAPVQAICAPGMGLGSFCWKWSMSTSANTGASAVCPSA